LVLLIFPPKKKSNPGSRKINPGPQKNQNPLHDLLQSRRFNAKHINLLGKTW
jgi:hypothetical protein